MATEYIEPSIPARFKLKRAVVVGDADNISYSYDSWHILCLDPETGEITSMNKNNSGPDYKLEKTAQRQATVHNKYWHDDKDPNSCIYIVRKCKTTVEVVN